MTEGNDFKIDRQVTFASPSQNPNRKKSGRRHGLGELAEILGFLFNISAMAKASDFKFGTQLEFAKAHHKISPRIKSVALG